MGAATVTTGATATGRRPSTRWGPPAAHSRRGAAATTGRSPTPTRRRCTTTPSATCCTTTRAGWRWVRPGGGSITQTTLNYTGQRLDGTGLLYYHARYYDPVLARFVSADSVVPGAEA